jgi:hypothetical protein
MTLPRPQRILPPSAPGSLLKTFASPAPRPRAIETDIDRAYLKNVRECPCLMCGLDPCGEAAHVRFASAAYGKASGLNKTPPDKFALPVCGDDHRVARHAQHNRNEQEFWASLGINSLLTCERLYAQRGDLVAMRAVIFSTTASRNKTP